ncbi:hypothetical protein LCGC14_1593320, partial [marine sediment metagenome]
RKSKPVSEYKYGDWRNDIDWKVARILVPLYIIVAVVLGWYIFVG